MRDIKFQAWDTRKKCMYSAEELGIDQLTIIPDGRGFINVHGNSTKLSTFPTHLIPLQFTGLCDKNGKKIWIGDIYSYWQPLAKAGRQVHKEHRAVVVDDIPELYYLSNRAENGHGGVEVIGDIYSTPELMEQAR